MSRCIRGSFFVWLLTLLLTGALCKSLDGADQVWRDWLLVEDNPPSDTAAGTLVRRITPKSVFVAPSFNSGCKEGQQVDSDGRCVQIVKVDQAAHLDFLLKRFNSMFAPPPSKKVEKDSPGPFHVSLPLGGVDRPETATTTKSPTTSPSPLTTTTEKTTQKTETDSPPTTTLTMPPSTFFSTAVDPDPTTELLNFSDESTTSRIPHETSTKFFTRTPPSTNPTYPSTTTEIEELLAGSHRTQSLPTTFNTQTDLLFGGVHRTRPSSLHTTVTAPETTSGEPLENFHRTSPPSTQTVFTSPTTLQTIQPFEGLHRTRPSSLFTSLAASPTVKTDETFTLKGFQTTKPSSSHVTYTTTSTATTTFHPLTDSPEDQNSEMDKEYEHENKDETLLFGGNSDIKKPFVIIVANNTFKRQEQLAVSHETRPLPDYYDSTTETTTLGSSIPESTSDSDILNESHSTTESTTDTQFESDHRYFSSVLTPPPTVDEYSLERFPAVAEIPSYSGVKDSLDGASSFQQMSSIENTRSKCDSSYEVSQLRDGRIISQSSVTNCQPNTEALKTTTEHPPIRTVAPYAQSTNFRFPLESQTANRPSYVRFPELSASSNYNTKVWGNENEDEDKSQQPTYYWPVQSSWNPFPSSVVRGWPVMDRSHISSNVYRKQFYQHPVPQWMNKNSNQYSWPVRRV